MKHILLVVTLLPLAAAYGGIVPVQNLAPVSLNAGSQQIRLAEFPVKTANLYRIRGQIKLSPAAEKPLTVTLKFYEAGGRDLAVTEQALGFTQSEQRWTASRPGTAEFQFIAVAGRTQTNPVKGVLFLDVPAGKGERSLNVSGIKVEENPVIQATAETAGIEVLSPDTNTRYAVNLAPNPSFEQLKNGLPVGWHFTGSGKGELSSDTCTGDVAIRLPAGSDGRWECTPAPIDPSRPIQLVYRTRFSRYATPFGQLDPVRLVFLKKLANGKWQQLPPRKRLEFPFGDFTVKAAYGQWLTVAVPRCMPPDGATHVKLQIAIQEVMKHGLGDLYAHWGDVKVDDILLYQPSGEPVPPVLGISRYAPLFADGGEIRPPFLPVGRKRENTAIMYQMRTADGNLYFADEGAKPSVVFAVGNLLAISRELTLIGKITDCDGKVIDNVKQKITLAPYRTATVHIPLRAGLRFGAYALSAELYDGQRIAGHGVVRFALLARRPKLNDAERFHPNYMFDMHPASFNGGWPLDDADAAEYETRIMRLLGVRGVRLGTHLRGLQNADPETARQVALKRADAYKNAALPLLRKNNLEYYLTFSEQGRHNFPAPPKTARELAAFEVFFKTYAAAVAGDAKFIIFGNEALGAHTTIAGADENLFSRSSFCGSTRDWLRVYLAAYRGAKAGAPDLPFGPGQACDENAEVPIMLQKLAGKKFPADCWAFNAYGNTPEMARNLAAETKKFQTPPRFAVIPERGFTVPVRGPERITGERDQAIQCVSTYVETRANTPWVTRLAWFIFDGSNIGTSDRSHGVYDDGGPRPIAAAYATLTDTLGAGTVEHDERFSDGRLLFWRRINGQLIGIGWSNSPRKILIETDAKTLFVSDIYGNRKPLSVKQGMAEVELTKSPVYLIGGKKLALSRRIELEAHNISTHSGQPQVALTLRNHSKTAVRVRVRVISHPLVRVTVPQDQLELKPEKSITKIYPVRFLRRDIRKKTTLQFIAEQEDGIRYNTSLTDSFSGCVRAPGNFVPERDDAAWKTAEEFIANSRNQIVTLGKSAWSGPEELSARIATMYDSRNFYLRVIVRDDRFFAQQPPQYMFFNDSLEIGFNFGGPDYQFLAGRSTSGEVLYRCRPNPGIANGQVKVRPTGERGNVEYFVSIPWAALGGFIPEPGRVIRFGVIIDDSDGKPGDRKFIHWFGDGIHLRNSRLFAELIFYSESQRKNQQ